MEIIFLGTSSGTPTKNRNVSAIALLESQGKNWYLIDCGEGTQHQLLHSPLSLNTLNAIFITHVHGDHCYGLPGLLASAGMSGRKAPLTIVAPSGIKEWFESTQRLTELFLPYEIKFVATESMTTFVNGQYTVDAIELSHRVPSFAYSFSNTKVDTKLNFEKLTQLQIPKGPIWGQLKSGKNVTYEDETLLSSDFVLEQKHEQKVIICGDNDKPELLKEACMDCDLLVHEATFTEELAKQVGDVGHSYAKLVAQFAADVKLPNLILTHFSPRYQDNPESKNAIKDIHNEALSVFDKNLFIAHDFDRYRLTTQGKVVPVAI